MSNTNSFADTSVCGVKSQTPSTNLFVCALKDGKCKACRKSAKMVCSRCADFYCSVQCQRRDWPDHRSICIAMPLLISADEYFGENENIPQIIDSKELMQKKHVDEKAGTGEHVLQPQPQHKQRSMPLQEQQRDMQHMPNQPTNQRSMPLQDKKRDMQHMPNQQINQGSPQNKSVQPEVIVPEQNATVAITGFHSTNRVFVRSLNPDHTKAYMNILRQIDEYGKIAKPLTKLPNNHDQVMTRCNGTMHRARVFYVRNISTIKVVITDLGMMVHRDLSDLREISEEMANLPQYAVMMNLRGVPMYQNYNEQFQKFLETQSNKYTIKYAGAPEVRAKIQLICQETGNVLNESVNNFLKTIEGKESDIVNNDDTKSAISQPTHKNPFKINSPPMNTSSEMKLANGRQQSSMENGTSHKSVGSSQIKGSGFSQKLPEKPQFTKSQQSPQKPQFAKSQQSLEKPQFAKPQQSPDKPQISQSQQSPQKPQFAKSQQSQEKPQFAKPQQSTDKPQISQSQQSPQKPQFAKSQQSQEKPQFAKPQQSPDKPQISQSQQSPEKPPVAKSQLPILEPPFEMTLLEEGETNVPVVVLDTSSIRLGYIGCMKQSYMNQLQMLTKTINNMKLNDEPAYTPVLYEYCMAKYDGEWFRAKVIEKSRLKFGVIYLDFTNTLIVTPSEIRRYPDDLTTPCAANICLLNNCPTDLSEKHIALLKEHFEQKTAFSIDKVVSLEMEDNPTVVLIDYHEAEKILNE